jgi:tetratricopeptide (TPR) repeat protein
MGEVGEALDRLGEGHQLLERQTARGLVGQRGWAFYALGRAGLLLGRLDEARSLSNRAIESSPCHPGYVAHARHLLGDIAAHPDRFDPVGGEAHYREALALAQPRGMRPLVAHCHLGLGMLYRRTDKREQAEKHVATATTTYREMGMTYWLERAEAGLRQ